VEGVNELQEAVDAFNKANESIRTWDPDYKRKVAIPPGTQDANAGSHDSAPEAKQK
jgi:hypothetical protein